MVSLEKYAETHKAFVSKFTEDDKELRVCDNALYMYQDGAWAAVGMTELNRLDRALKDTADDTQFPYAEKYSQLWRHIKASLPLIEPDELDKSGYISLPNGTLDPLTGTLYSHDPDHLTTRKVAVPYDAKAKCPRWEAMLDRILEDKDEKTRKQYIDFLQQWFGLALVGYRKYSGRPYRKLLFLYGAEGTGKSTLADVLRELIGEGDIASESVDQLSSRFGLASVVRSRAIVSDDAVGGSSKVEAAVLKKLVTGEPMTADRKMQHVVSFRYYGPIMITANKLPEVKDATHALYGRCVVLTLDRQFTSEDAKRDLLGYTSVMDMLRKKKEMPGILNWALKGLAKVVDNHKLPDVTEAIDAANTWREDNDPVYAFLREHCTYDPDVYNYQVPLAWAVSVYAETQMADRTYTPRRVKTLLGREAKNVIRGVQVGSKQWQKSPNRIMMGLRIDEQGWAYYQKAREKGIAGNEPYPVNERVL